MNNIFDLIPANLEAEVSERLAEGNGIKIERIISSGQRSDWYDQDNNEWVMLLRGEAILGFADGASIKLKSGDYINLPAHQKHRVEWTAPDTETIWLAVHY